MDPVKDAWLSELRSHSQMKFNEGDGYNIFNQHEEWKYTSLKNLQTQEIQSGEPVIGFSNISEMLTEPNSAKTKDRLAYLRKNLQSPNELTLASKGGLYVNYIAKEIKNHSKVLQDYLNITYDHDKPKPLVLENTARFEHGILLLVSEGTSLTLPIHLFVANFEDGKTQYSSYIRNVIILEANSSLVLIEDYAGNSKTPYFNQVVNEIILKPNARLQHMKWQCEGKKSVHFCTNEILQYQDSCYSSDVFTMGASLSRNEIHVKMLGERCHSRLNGVYAGRGVQHSDHHIKVEHTKPKGVSSQFYRGTLKEKSTGVFRGNIHVHPGAQKTNACQSSKTLLLSQEAEMNAKPQLEIFADDVICSHGTTIGQLEEDALFYMNSRGISHEEAISILERAFLSEAMEDYPDTAYKKYLLDMVEKVV